MENNYEVINLVNTKKQLEQKLNSMPYGSIEIRENDSNKYIYVHYRDNGIVQTKYVGEYKDELYNFILNNNKEVKTIKKEIKEINKKLNNLNYISNELNEQIKLNIDFAKRNLVDTIYKQAILEGVATTYAEVENIIDGGKVNDMTPDDILKIINLKHAWEFILNENVIYSNHNLYLLCQINKLVEEGFYYNAGKIRSTPVKIGGTSWTPDLPIESIISEELETIINKKITHVDKAIELLLYVMKKQIFLDGNKRTAIIFANHFLISEGTGIIVIPANLITKYKELLISYYEGKNQTTIKEFLKKDCYQQL